MCGLHRQLAQEVHFHCRVLVMFLNRCLTNPMHCDTIMNGLAQRKAATDAVTMPAQTLVPWGKLKTSAS